jgi:hypothetical protein
MPIVVTAAQDILVGQPGHIEGRAPAGDYAGVFEDDGNTGYFYALDYGRKGQPIQNALHIYNVGNVTDRHVPSQVKIGWSADSSKVVLLINGYPHGVFDFSSRQAYCRTGFPQPASDSGWSGHQWSESAIQLFSQ